MSTRKQTRVISEELIDGTPEDGDFLITSIFYQLGGLSYFNYKQEARGYYLSVRRVHRERVERPNGGSYSTESFMMFTGGIKSFIAEANMFSAKRLAQLEPSDGLIQNLKHQVLLKA